MTTATRKHPDEIDRVLAIGRWTVRLADGNDWRVPLVLPASADRESDLPPRCAIRLENAPSRSLVDDVAPEYSDLVRMAEEVWEIVQSPDELPRELKVQYAAALLAVNYKITAEDLLTWGLIGKREVDQLIFWSLDMAERIRLETETPLPATRRA